MIDFLKYLTIYNYIGILAFVIGLYYALQGKRSLKYFTGFLFFVNFIEIFLNYYLSKKYGSSEQMYSYYGFLTSLYYIFIFYLYFRNKSWSFYLFMGIFLWVVFCLYTLIRTEIPLELTPYYSGMIITTILIFAYFYHVLYIEKYKNLKKEAIFYLGIGILLFVFSTFPIIAFYDELVLDLNYSDYFMLLVQFGNVFIYLGYLGVVLCMTNSY